MEQTTELKRKLQPYNGHRSWNAWNVSLWINNDEGLYNFARSAMKQANNKPGRAARIMLRDLQGSKTPDGAAYNHLSIMEAIRDINE
jgi:hypothetical protein